MEISISNNNEKTIVSIIGRIDTTNADQFQQEISPLMEMEHPNIEIDCKLLEYTSSQGLRLFLMLQKNVSSKKGILIFSNMKQQVKEIFDITGFSNIIKIQ